MALPASSIYWMSSTAKSMTAQELRAHRHKHILHGSKPTRPGEASQEGKRCLMVCSLKCVLQLQWPPYATATCLALSQLHILPMLQPKSFCAMLRWLCSYVIPVAALASFWSVGMAKWGPDLLGTTGRWVQVTSHILAHFTWFSMLKHFSPLLRFSNSVNDAIRKQILCNCDILECLWDFAEPILLECIADSLLHRQQWPQRPRSTGSTEGTLQLSHFALRVQSKVGCHVIPMLTRCIVNTPGLYYCICWCVVERWAHALMYKFLLSIYFGATISVSPFTGTTTTRPSQTLDRWPQRGTRSLYNAHEAFHFCTNPYNWKELPQNWYAFLPQLSRYLACTSGSSTCFVKEVT